MNRKLFLVALLACLAITISVIRFTHSLGIDFYQYWGVSKAKQWSVGQLKSPAAEQEKYAQVLNEQADHSADLRLIMANETRRGLQLLQTPLCYSLFTLLPANYSLAFGVFQIIQVMLFLSALVLLSAVHYGNWLRLLSLALLLLIFYEPVAADLRFGNLNCLYLFGLSLLLVLADGFASKRFLRPAIGPGIAFMGLLVFLTLFKPNWNLVILLFAAYLWVVQGPPVFARSALAGMIFGAFLVALPCLQFHSWSVWQDWYRYARTWDIASLTARMHQGNLAPVLFFSRISGSSVASSMGIISALLILSIVLALARAAGNKGSLVKGMAWVAGQSLRDPHLIMAIGIMATFFLSPLVWLHYYTLSLLPAFWLLSPRHPWRQAHKAAWISLILTSNIITGLMERRFGFNFTIIYASAVLGLVPLWAGILAAIVVNARTVSD
ncbi:MAG: glycosyltransferase 87 family protein [Desulfobaccales bacterium]